jgi:alanyl-tRNA synthetase
MTASEIRQSFLDFFRERQHTIVPSSSLLPSSPNLLFTNAGMNQFVPYFLGEAQPPFHPPRAADTQKCIRAGGKHNDLDDVGFDTYHQTFFEMLGNWSFGDYFKREAIEWAWELLVGRWGFPPERLYATVYRPGPGDPAEFDQEASDAWSEQFRRAKLGPAVHVVAGNRKDNFWMMGDTGPCGPCSEIHMDLTPAGDTEGALVNQGSPWCIEIWNLVFIQFNANPDGTFSALPSRHVDTGMGFERVAGIVAGTKRFVQFQKLASNYDSDAFQPIFAEIGVLSGKSYGGTLPDNRADLSGQQRIDVAFRVIADHIRTLACAIADGILPGNNDRNYVVRRILRRAVMFGRDLGFGEHGFLAALAPVVVRELGPVFPELKREEPRIVKVLADEEDLFNRTLDRGLRLFSEQASKVNAQVFPAEAAFRLYDTYGFPVDLTQVLAAERGLTVDTAAVEKLLDEQRERSRAAQAKELVTAGDSDITTEFVGFETDVAEAVALEKLTSENHQLVAIDRSPLYAEMGGQVSDTGKMRLPDGSVARVEGVIKQGRTFYLKLPVDEKTFALPATVTLEVDHERRRQIEANHTATHLLHWALHEVVSAEIGQKGSYVGPDRLRFDVNSSPLPEDLQRAVEREVNARIIANDPVSWTEIPFREISGRRDIMQFFGDKYGDRVRVVQIGGTSGQLNGYSMELCGGTHVHATGEIGPFVLTNEGAIAAGVRRLEALTGLAALQFLRTELAQSSARTQALESELLELKKAVEKERQQALQREADNYVSNLRLTDRVLIQTIENATGDFLQAVANALKARKFQGAAVLFGKQPDQITVLAMSGSETAKTLPANRLVQELTSTLGGKGGGRPDLARGVGRDLTKLTHALEQARALTSETK